MKVICISDKWKKSPEEKLSPSPFVGEKCEVIDSTIYQGDLYYQLGGRFNKHSGFKSDMFAPISEIDETEFERSYNKELVN